MYQFAAVVSAPAIVRNTDSLRDAPGVRVSIVGPPPAAPCARRRFEIGVRAARAEALHCRPGGPAGLWPPAAIATFRRTAGAAAGGRRMRKSIRASAWLGALLAAAILFSARGADAHEYFIFDDLPLPIGTDGKRHI